MLQAIMTEPRKIVLEEVPVPEPQAHQVLVRMKYNAICGSEFSPYLGIATTVPHYLGVTRYPHGPFGHEGAGEVVKVGAEVRGFQVGDRAVMVGGYAEYKVFEAKELCPIPEGVSFRDASLTMMAQEAAYVVDLMNIKPEDQVFISGLGPGGLLVLEAVRDTGCAVIIGADLLPHRLEAARRLGATLTLNPRKTDVASEVAKTTGGGATIAIDTTGLPPSIFNAFKAAARYGKVGIFGRPLERVNNFEIEDIFHKFLTVIGLKCEGRGYSPQRTRAILNKIRDGRIHADVIITHEFPLAQINEAFELAAVRKEGLKVTIRCT